MENLDSEPDGEVDVSFGPFALCDTHLEAEAVRERIYNELEGTTIACFALEQSWTRVGVLLSEFKAKECWREFPEYGTFDDFMNELKTRFHRGRTVLYGYMGCAEKLLPAIGAEKLEAMGISKALELKRALKKLDGKPLPAGLLEAALKPDVTTKELHANIGQALSLEPEPKGTWFDLDGFFITPEERAEFKETWLMSESLLGLSSDIPDHIRRKEVILSWMREWRGTHAAEYYGVEMPPNVEPVLLTPLSVAPQFEEADRICQHNNTQFREG